MAINRRNKSFSTPPSPTSSPSASKRRKTSLEHKRPKHIQTHERPQIPASVREERTGKTESVPKSLVEMNTGEIEDLVIELIQNGSSNDELLADKISQIIQETTSDPNEKHKIANSISSVVSRIANELDDGGDEDLAGKISSNLTEETLEKLDITEDAVTSIQKRFKSKAIKKVDVQPFKWEGGKIPKALLFLKEFSHTEGESIFIKLSPEDLSPETNFDPINKRGISNKILALKLKNGAEVIFKPTAPEQSDLAKIGGLTPEERQDINAGGRNEIVQVLDEHLHVNAAVDIIRGEFNGQKGMFMIRATGKNLAEGEDGKMTQQQATSSRQPGIYEKRLIGYMESAAKQYAKAQNHFFDPKKASFGESATSIKNPKEAAHLPPLEKSLASTAKALSNLRDTMLPRKPNVTMFSDDMKEDSFNKIKDTVSQKITDLKTLRDELEGRLREIEEKSDNMVLFLKKFDSLLTKLEELDDFSKNTDNDWITLLDKLDSVSKETDTLVDQLTNDTLSKYHGYQLSMGLTWLARTGKYTFPNGPTVVSSLKEPNLFSAMWVKGTLWMQSLIPPQVDDSPELREQFIGLAYEAQLLASTDMNRGNIFYNPPPKNENSDAPSKTPQIRTIDADNSSFHRFVINETDFGPRLELEKSSEDQDEGLFIQEKNILSTAAVMPSLYLPKVIGRTQYDAFLKLDTKELTKLYQAKGLSEKEIASVVQRLNAIKKHIQSDSCQVVEADQWNDPEIFIKFEADYKRFLGVK